ncbi:tail fiber protein [Pseudomonas sp. 21LCFQ02]|uniref:phage tail protein n=1 Tax=Pseudomonas sp. 21LCFQ02 TaxID=2957505 RepID=UPI00209B4C19|nr:tail fiber protein [Pseudomonas sp. 21LCFQ02]MCO8169972.1 tail fiber protein [Pseudomonas sp. 21LCFQ02]
MEAFIGTILPWPLNWAPKGWMFCDGSSLPIQQNAALYSLLGTRYGGDGQTTFKLPDLRKATPIGVSGTPLNGQDISKLGAKGGNLSSSTTTTAVLTVAQLPGHIHPASVEINATTTVQVGTALTGGALVPTQDAVLTSTTAGQTNAAAIYLPSTATPVAPVTLAGVKTQVVNTATGKVTVDKNITTNAPVTLASTADMTPPYQTLNFIICLLGIYPPRN